MSSSGVRRAIVDSAIWFVNTTATITPSHLRHEGIPTENPGQGTVSRLCCEPRVAHTLLDKMLSPAVGKGNLTVKTRCVPLHVDADGDIVKSVTVRDMESGHEENIRAAFVLDASELGDLLPLGGAEYVTGAESQRDTSEPHAVSRDPEPENVQGITWCFAMGFEPGGNHVISKPEQYERWRSYEPEMTPPYSGRLLDWAYSHPHTLVPFTRGLFPAEDNGPSFWTYRRLVCASHYPPDRHPYEVTLVNWPQNDWGRNGRLRDPGSARGYGHPASLTSEGGESSPSM